jgi:hypothetical protein
MSGTRAKTRKKKQKPHAAEETAFKDKQVMRIGLHIIF